MTDFPDLARAKRGLRLQIAAGLGLNKSAVYQWKRVPASRVLDVERITGISRHDLRPDLYPRGHKVA
jgi:DNA-binding transcriptional regulator YdaS (Cro superfamily)